MHHFATGFGNLADRIANTRSLELAGVGDGQAEDRTGIKGAVGRRGTSVKTAAHGRVGFGKKLGRRGGGGAGRGAKRIGEELRADALDEVGRVHAVIEQEALRAALLYPGAHDGGAVAGVTNEIQRGWVALERIGDLGVVRRLCRVVRGNAGEFAAQRLVGLAELGQHVDAKVVVDMDHGEGAHALVQRIFGCCRALQRIAGDGAEKPAVGFAFSRQSG